MMKFVAVSVLMLGLVSTADAKYTIGRPIDNVLGTVLDHSYTTEDNQGQCVENFGGSCDCAGQSACYWYQHAAGNGNCYNSFFSRWTYLKQGVCHQATNNNAYYMGGPSPGYMGSGVRGMGTSVATFGYWGTDGGC
jgi:hypothetical protein